MTPKFTSFKFTILTFFLCGILTTAKAAGPYPVYLTQKGKVTLGFQTALKSGETAVWTEDGNPVTSNLNGSYSIDADGKSVGVHTYKVHLVSPDPALCKGDVVEYQVYILPTPTVKLTASSNLYCTNAETRLSELTATATADPLPDGIKYNFIWEGTLGATTQNPADGWGALGTPAATSSTFNFTSAGVGTYSLKVKVEYVVTDPTKSVLRTDANTYAAMVTEAQSIVVSPMPATPEIIVVAE